MFTFQQNNGTTDEVASEVPNFANSVKKGKSIPKALLNTGSNLVNNRLDINPLSLLRGPGIMLTKTEMKDFIKLSL